MLRKDFIFIVSVFIIFFAVNYPFLDRAITGFLTENDFQISHVDRIIDGDTIKIGNQSVRLLGINTPESGEKYSDEAKEYLSKNILNERISLEFGKEKYDLYRRILAYVLKDGENINLKIVENGFANYYFPSGKDKYYEDFKTAWEKCIDSNKNLCEKSKDICSECIVLRELDAQKNRAVFQNVCSFRCDLTNWNIKDEGRKHFLFYNIGIDGNSDFAVITGNGTDDEKTLFWKDEEYVWTKSGDTLFLRDSDGLLVLWHGY